MSGWNLESNDIEDICDVPWEYNANDYPFASPQQYFKDWLNGFNLNVADHLMAKKDEDECTS